MWCIESFCQHAPEGLWCGGQVLHFVGHRKKALRLVHQAYMQGGLQGAYQLLSVLPHSEQDYAELDIPALENYLLQQEAAAAA